MVPSVSVKFAGVVDFTNFEKYAEKRTAYEDAFKGDDKLVTYRPLGGGMPVAAIQRKLQSGKVIDPINLNFVSAQAAAQVEDVLIIQSAATKPTDVLELVRLKGQDIGDFVKSAQNLAAILTERTAQISEDFTSKLTAATQLVNQVLGRR